MALKRLSGRKRCDRLARKGRTWKGAHMQIKYLMGPPDHPNVDPSESAVYIGIAASTKLDKSAVKRNRMRRRVREAFRLYVKTHPCPTVQLIVRPQSSSLKCAFSAVEADVVSFFSSLS